MDALTIRQPFAWAVVEGHKAIENRTWEPSARVMNGWIAIHAAAAAPAASAVEHVRALSPAAPPTSPTCGAIIGVARVSGVVRKSNSPWFDGPVGWVFDAVVAIRPVPARGQLKLWRVPAPIEREVERRVREAEGSTRPRFPRYWLVKGKQALTDWNGIKREGARSTWFTRRPPRDWAPGDEVVLWEAAPASRLVGLAELAGPPRRRADGETHFPLRTTRVVEPVSAARLRRNPVLAEATFLKSGPAGTVFALRSSEMDAIRAAIS